MVYEFDVQTVSGSSFDNLERLGERLQDALGAEDSVSRMQAGWELWQVNSLHDAQGINGLILTYRRAKS